MKVPAAALDHRRLWDAMDVVADEQITEIEQRLARRAIEEFHLDCSGLVLDMTNFATFLDSTNTRAPIAQRMSRVPWNFGDGPSDQAVRIPAIPYTQSGVFVRASRRPRSGRR